MRRAEAFALVRARGGMPRAGVTRKTNVLVVGEFGWPLVDDGRPSNSLAQAKAYGVPIASERQFLAWLGRAVPDEQARTYAADQVAALAKIPRDLLDNLAMFGLVEPQGGLYGFRDLAAARQVGSLLASGIALSVITKSLYDIRKWLPEARLSSLRLFPESSDRILIEQMKGFADKTGQFVLPVGMSDDDPDVLFEAAQAAEDRGEVAEAERLYRRLIKVDGADAVGHFNLANLLRARGRIAEAEAAYRDATRADPGFPAAWYNLADILDDAGRVNEAIAALECAIKADPNHADAIFNLALMLQKLDRPAEAAAYWRRYLELDDASSWSARARRALKFCEIKLAAASRGPS